MSKVFIFDVDGTLTPSRQKMTQDFSIFFSLWSMDNTFYLVTGSDIDKTKEQVPWYILERAEAIFTCCGNQMWRDDELIYDNKFEPPKDLIEYLKEQLEKSTYHHRAGNHIEDRGSMLNFSIVGRNCSLMERENYFKWDIKEGERREISRAIGFRWPELDAVIGGQISVDIYPKGNDKSQILKHIKQNINMDSHTKTLADSFEYIFIGDRMEKGGNDYPLAQLLQTQDRPYGYTYETEGPEHTQRILEKTHND